MLLCDDVFDVERRGGRSFIRQVTIFAPLSGAGADELSQRSFHRAFADRLRTARAFAWRTAMKSMA